MDIGRVGLWTTAVRGRGDVAPLVQELGFGALWLGGSPPVSAAQPLLAATSRLVVATGITSIWEHPASDVARATAGLPDRFLLGLGVSHASRTPGYTRPYAALVDYLTDLDVPRARLVLAALGPRMLRLARDRAAGAHPYLVTADYVGWARSVLGPGPLLAPELKVVLDPDRGRARATARAHLTPYLALPNYTANLRRLGFTDDDLRDGGSDRLLDATFALGDDDAAARRFDEFVAAGADHVAVHVVTPDSRTVPPVDAWRRLAGVLL